MSLEAEAARGALRFCVELSSHTVIDEEGIVPAIRGALARAVRSLASPAEAHVFLDGSLYAPKEYEQETIIRGDSQVPAIMLASVAAKVTRDRLMLQYANEYPEYGFERHKGYGTALHMEAVRMHGASPIHRRTYIRGISNA